MIITKNTPPLKNGTIVYLKSEEMLYIVDYLEHRGGYMVQFIEPDGDEYFLVGEERFMPAFELIGGEV